MRYGRSNTKHVIAVLATVGLGAAACSSSPGSSPPTSAAGGNPDASASTTPPSSSSATVKVADSATFGKILVDSAGDALYTFGADKGHDGQSTCTGGCIQAWPALTVAAGTAPTGGAGVTGTLAAVKQANGTYQVTYNGLPLYTFVQDSSAGQATGNNVSGFSVATVSTGSSGSGSSGSGSSATTATSSGGYGGY